MENCWSNLHQVLHTCSRSPRKPAERLSSNIYIYIYGESTATTIPMATSPLEKGWGWVVLSSCFVINGFSFTLPKIISTFFKDLIYEFGVGYRDTAWFSSILLATLYGIGPISSVLVNRFTCRPVMIAGGILASLGMILASFCTTMIQLYMMTGITGYILDRTKSYHVIFFLAGSMVFLAGIVIGFGNYFCLNTASSLQSKEAAKSAINDGSGQVEHFKDCEAENDRKSPLKIPEMLEDLEHQSSATTI
uniref:uncharacterized protein isoform X4 n=1 Tax=Myxine glutinosa TaxID=7769 RepID=UPI0035901657